MCKYTMPDSTKCISDEPCSLAGATFEGNMTITPSYAGTRRQDLTMMTLCKWPCCCHCQECFDLVLSRLLLVWAAHRLCTAASLCRRAGRWCPLMAQETLEPLEKKHRDTQITPSYIYRWECSPYKSREHIIGTTMELGSQTAGGPGIVLPELSLHWKPAVESSAKEAAGTVCPPGLCSGRSLRLSEGRFGGVEPHSLCCKCWWVQNMWLYQGESQLLTCPSVPVTAQLSLTHLLEWNWGWLSEKYKEIKAFIFLNSNNEVSGSIRYCGGPD